MKNLNITNIVIVQSSGPDRLIMQTNLPNGEYPYTGNAHLMLSVAYDMGPKYAKDHFPGCPFTLVERV